MTSDYEVETCKSCGNEKFTYVGPPFELPHVAPGTTITYRRWNKSPMTLEEYQRWTPTLSLYGDKVDPLFLGLCEEAGEVAGKRKKYLRGDYRNIEFTPDRLDDDSEQAMADYVYEEHLKKELGDVMWYVSEICNAHGLTIQEVIEGNVAKLTDRKERGVIAGSGDSR